MSHSLALDISVANQVLGFAQLRSIRQATVEDLPQISTIENLTSAYPCSNKQLHDCLGQTFVLIEDNRLMGFAIIAVIEHQAELHSIAINTQAQGKGLGSLFLNALVAALPATIEQFYLEVRVSNYRAIRLYHQAGFSKIAERKDYYRNGLGREDAIIMAKSIK